MINDKKSEGAALSYCAKCLEITNRNIDLDKDECVDLYNGFINGAKWAINEFIKDLWHPASEKPNIKQRECCVTCLVKFKNGSTELCVYFRNPEGWVCDDMTPKDFKRHFKGWLYIDDLLPKKGDEQ